MNMTAKELVDILNTLPPGAREVTVKGRRAPMISASIPDGPLPSGWRSVAESSTQAAPDWRRVIYA
jgi:hypothetical protein